MNPLGNRIGLSICQQICERLGGGIKVASSLGSGTKFTFNIKVLDYSQHPALSIN